MVGFIHEDRLRELLTTMGDRFTDEEVMHFLIINSYVTGTVAANTNYRPQRSCEGYVFTGVCLSTGGGGCLSACWDITPPRSRHPPVADPPPPPRSRHPPEQTLPQEQTPPKADTPPEQTSPPRYGHCCGRYASYWNAFLFYCGLSNLLYFLAVFNSFAVLCKRVLLR